MEGGEETSNVILHMIIGHVTQASALYQFFYSFSKMFQELYDKIYVSPSNISVQKVGAGGGGSGSLPTSELAVKGVLPPLWVDYILTNFFTIMQETRPITFAEEVTFRFLALRANIRLPLIYHPLALYNYLKYLTGHDISYPS